MLLFFCKDTFGIKIPTNVDIPFNTEMKLNQIKDSINVLFNILYILPSPIAVLVINSCSEKSKACFCVCIWELFYSWINGRSILAGLSNTRVRFKIFVSNYTYFITPWQLFPTNHSKWNPSADMLSAFSPAPVDWAII